VIDELRGQTAVVEVRELFEHEAGQQLGLSKLIGAVLVSVRTNSPVGDLQDPARGFARSHISGYVARSGQVRWISTEHSRTLNQKEKTETQMSR